MTTFIPEGPVGDARFDYAKAVVQGLRNNLIAPEPIRLHIADDGSPGLSEKVLDLSTNFWKQSITTTCSKRHGIGASLNRALKSIDSDLWLYITDDWVLTEKLDLSRAIKLLRDFDYGLVRLGPIHPNVVCETRFHTDVGYWLELVASLGGFCFATRPFIAHRRFTDAYGPFLEGANAYETEQDYTERVCQNSGPKIAYDGDLTLNGPWKHIGECEVGTIKPPSQQLSDGRYPGEYTDWAGSE